MTQRTKWKSKSPNANRESGKQASWMPQWHLTLIQTVLKLNLIGNGCVWCGNRPSEDKANSRSPLPQHWKRPIQFEMQHFSFPSLVFFKLQSNACLRMCEVWRGESFSQSGLESCQLLWIDCAKRCRHLICEQLSVSSDCDIFPNDSLSKDSLRIHSTGHVPGPFLSGPSTVVVLSNSALGPLIKNPQVTHCLYFV